MTPLDPSLKGKNIQIFDNTSKDKVSHHSYLVARFTEIINESLDQDLSGSGLVKMFNLFLNAPSDSEQDLSEEEGHSP